MILKFGLGKLDGQLYFTNKETAFTTFFFVKSCTW